MFILLRSNLYGAAGVEINDGVYYQWISSNYTDGVFGSVAIDPIMASSIDQSPRKVGQREGSRTFGATVLITGTSWNDYASLRDAIIEEVHDVNQHGGRLRVQGDDAEFPVEFDIQHISMGPLHSHMAEAGYAHRLELSFTCSPYVYGDPMDVRDDFSEDTFTTGGLRNNGGSDWTALNGTLPTTKVSDRVQVASGVTVNAKYTGSNYTYSDCQVSVMGTLPRSSGAALGVLTKIQSDDSHIRVRVRDDGTNTILDAHYVDSAGATTLAGSATFAARLVSGGLVTVRARIEGDTVYAEAVTDAGKGPFYKGSIYASFNFSTSATAFSAGVEGGTGMHAVGVGATATQIDVWDLRGFTYMSHGTDILAPIQVRSYGTVPGTAKAKADMIVTTYPSGCYHYMMAWMPVPSEADFNLPYGLKFGLNEWGSSLPGPGTGFTYEADALASNGNLWVATSAGALNVRVDFYKDFLEPYSIGETVLVKVFARLKLTSTLDTLTAKLSVGSSNTRVYSLEYGTAGKNLLDLVPTAGSDYVIVSLGTVPVTKTKNITFGDPDYLEIAVTGDDASEWGIDYIMLVDSSAMAATPYGISDADSGGFFVDGQIKINSDLSTSRLIEDYENSGYNALNLVEIGGGRSLLGNQIELSPGSEYKWLVALLDNAIDYESSTSFENTYASFQVSVTPRYWIGG